MTKSQVQSSRCLQCFRKLVGGGGGEVFIPFLYNFRGPSHSFGHILISIFRDGSDRSLHHMQKKPSAKTGRAAIVIVIHKQHFLKTDLDNAQE